MLIIDWQFIKLKFCCYRDLKLPLSRNGETGNFLYCYVIFNCNFLNLANNHEKWKHLGPIRSSAWLENSLQSFFPLKVEILSQRQSMDLATLFFNWNLINWLITWKAIHVWTSLQYGQFYIFCIGRIVFLKIIEKLHFGC